MPKGSEIIEIAQCIECVCARLCSQTGKRMNPGRLTRRLTFRRSGRTVIDLVGPKVSHQGSNQRVHLWGIDRDNGTG